MFDDDNSPRNTKTLGFAAISAAILTLTCIAIGQGASQFAGLTASAPPETAMAASAPKAKAPSFNAIDYATTGAIKGQTVVISPCDR